MSYWAEPRDSVIDRATPDPYYCNLDAGEFQEVGARAYVYQVEETDGGSWPPYLALPMTDEPTEYERGYRAALIANGLMNPDGALELRDVLPTLREGPLRRYDEGVKR